MVRTPRKHQIQALEYAKDRDQIALFMEMRLGKSMVAIRWAETKPGRHLVIAPLTVLPSWEEELREEGIQDIYYLKKEDFSWTNSWYLVNYEALRAKSYLLTEVKWTTIICDESTKIRNPQAQITKLLCKETPDCRKAILSGLPAPESVLDYFEQMRFLHGSFMGFESYWAFREKLFFAPAYAPYDYQPKKGVLDRIKKEIHSLGFVLTRQEAKMGPKKIYEKRYVTMNPKQKAMYKKVVKDFAFGDSIEEATKWATVKFVWLARIAGGFSPEKELLSNAKAVELLNLLQGELKGQKVVIWFRFNAELEYVYEAIKNLHIGGGHTNRVPVKITGKSSILDRIKATKRFKDSYGPNVMLCQVKCGKFGLNWSCASTAIYYSNAYDGEGRAQSEDRILDVGRKEPLLYIDLITKDTIDESVVSVLRQKWVNSRALMRGLVEDWIKRRKQK